MLETQHHDSTMILMIDSRVSLGSFSQAVVRYVKGLVFHVAQIHVRI